MIYNELVEDCFFHPRHVGDFKNEPLNLKRLENTLTRAGECLRIGFLIDENQILKARFKAQGAPYSIAMLEWLCRQVEGKTLDALSAVDYQKLVDIFAIPDSFYPAALRVSDLYNTVIDSIT